MQQRGEMWGIDMPKLEIAPDFVLTDTKGQEVRLSDYRAKRNVVLSFLRGFA